MQITLYPAGLNYSGPMYGTEHSPSAGAEDMRQALRLLESALARHKSLPPGPAGQDAARDAFVRSLEMLRSEADALRRALAG